MDEENSIIWYLQVVFLDLVYRIMSDEISIVNSGK